MADTGFYVRAREPTEARSSRATPSDARCHGRAGYKRVQPRRELPDILMSAVINTDADWWVRRRGSRGVAR